MLLNFTLILIFQYETLMLFSLVKDTAKPEALKAIEIKSIYFALRSASTYVRSSSEKFKQIMQCAIQYVVLRNRATVNNDHKVISGDDNICS